MAKHQMVVLTKEQEKELLTWARSTKLEHRYVVRAKIVLLSADNATYDEIQERLNVSRTMVSKWKLRFVKLGMKGLFDEKRSGKPSKYTEEDKARVVNLACSKPEGGHTSWTQRMIAAELGMSQTKVHDILKTNKLRPHKVEYWCGKSSDPEFEKKMLEIVGLYMNPPENAIVLCVDEKTQMQALDRTQPELPLRKGAAKRLTSTYKRHGVVSLIAALAVHHGEITARTMEKNNSINFLKFLKYLDRKYRNKQLHIIADNLSVHKQKDVMDWINRKRKIHIHFTPTYSSWLNQVEIWFRILSRSVLKGGVWQSKQQLASQILEYIDTYNKSKAKPFVWTYGGKSKSSTANKSQH